VGNVEVADVTDLVERELLSTGVGNQFGSGATLRRPCLVEGHTL